MDNKATREVVNYFFKMHGISSKTCCEPQEQCRREAIRAHSIPSSTVLSHLARDGHVVMLQMRLKLPPPAEISFQPVGINKATTFTGLCDLHDNSVFQPIDDSLPNPHDPEHLFLLAYRAVLREYHVVLQNALRFQATYKKRVEVGLSPGDVPCNSGLFALSHVMNAWECYEYKRQYDTAYLQQRWRELHHEVLVLHDQPPSIAVSSMFSLDDVPAPETPRVTLSVFPINNAVAIIFSATQSDTPFVSSYLSCIVAAESHYQKYLLSKLILQSCDNFVIAPHYFDAMPQTQKNAIGQFYADTILKNAEDYEDEKLFLF